MFYILKPLNSITFPPSNTQLFRESTYPEYNLENNYNVVKTIYP